MSARIPSRDSTGCRPFGAVRFYAKRMRDYEISRESLEIEIFVYFDSDECNNSRTKLKRSPGRWRASFDFVQILTRRRIKAEPQSRPLARRAYLFPTYVYDDTAFRRQAMKPRNVYAGRVCGSCVYADDFESKRRGRLDVLDIQQTRTAIRGGGGFRDGLSTRMCDKHFSNWFINRRANALV